MKAILAAAPVAILLAACAGAGNGMSNMVPAGSTSYWYGTSSSYESFNHDNVVCSASARKWGNLPLDSGPVNRMDRPAQRWPNSAAQDAYDACMSQKGWRAAG